MVCSHRSDAVGTGKNPHASVTLSLVTTPFRNHTPTTMRNTASQRSGDRVWLAAVSSWAVDTVEPSSSMGANHLA
jgi:hypothetical protein